MAKAKKSKLGFLMLTDHNVNCNDLPRVDGLTFIYGAEFTKHGGHCNMWRVAYGLYETYKSNSEKSKFTYFRVAYYASMN